MILSFVICYVFAACAIIYSIGMIIYLLSLEKGTEKMQEIASYIRKGAYAYMRRQFLYIFIISIFIAFLLSQLMSIIFAMIFLFGAFSSCLAGFIGMYISVQSNSKTTQACSESLEHGFDVSISAGSVTGFLVIGLSLVSIFVCVYINHEIFPHQYTYLAFCLGASFMSVFARIGGGIFTKGADVGADMSGKINLNLNEDDPRNPAVIADSVGDNVGDCAGMAADLFETYVAIILASFELLEIRMNELAFCIQEYILLIASCGMISSYIGVYFMKMINGKIINKLHHGMIASSMSSLMLLSSIGLAIHGYTRDAFTFATTSIIGVISSILIMIITEYYTSEKYRPVRQIVEASEAGHGTNVIAGLAVSLESSMLPIILICITILLSSSIAGIYGLMISSAAMLSNAAFIMTLDAYGPITDNAGGIAEMSNAEPYVRENTDILDSVGNITKAITKGYSVCVSGIAAIIFLNLLYSYELDIFRINKYQALSFNIINEVYMLVGLLLGAAITNLFASYCMKAVGKAATNVVSMIKKQYLQNAKIQSGEEMPDYTSIISGLTNISVREMLIPSALCLTPVIIYLLFVYIFTFNYAHCMNVINGLVVGNLITGIATALSMTAGGGAFDNAKKYIEQEIGKGSEMHKASITGDTVGDPYKDTAGPALNPMMKSISIISIITLLIIFR